MAAIARGNVAPIAMQYGRSVSAIHAPEAR